MIFCKVYMILLRHACVLLLLLNVPHGALCEDSLGIVSGSSWLPETTKLNLAISSLREKLPPADRWSWMISHTTPKEGEPCVLYLCSKLLKPQQEYDLISIEMYGINQIPQDRPFRSVIKRATIGQEIFQLVRKDILGLFVGLSYLPAHKISISNEVFEVWMREGQGGAPLRGYVYNPPSTSSLISTIRTIAEATKNGNAFEVTEAWAYLDDEKDKKMNLDLSSGKDDHDVASENGVMMELPYAVSTKESRGFGEKIRSHLPSVEFWEGFVIRGPNEMGEFKMRLLARRIIDERNIVRDPFSPKMQTPYDYGIWEIDWKVGREEERRLEVKAVALGKGNTISQELVRSIKTEILNHAGWLENSQERVPRRNRAVVFGVGSVNFPYSRLFALFPDDAKIVNDIWILLQD